MQKRKEKKSVYDLREYSLGRFCRKCLSSPNTSKFLLATLPYSKMRTDFPLKKWNVPVIVTKMSYGCLAASKASNETKNTAETTRWIGTGHKAIPLETRRLPVWVLINVPV